MDYLLERSLGKSIKNAAIREPELPSIEISHLETANPMLVPCLRDQVILGFVPDMANTVLAIRSPARLLLDDDAHSTHEDSEIDTILIWTIEPGTLRIYVLDSAWPMSMLEFKTLVCCHSAILRGTDQLTQVRVFCPDPDVASGTIILSGARDISRRETRDWRVCTMACSTTEASHASICFSRSTRYVAVLLRTRCLFFLLDCDEHARTRKDFWTEEGMDKEAIRGFEFDIFVERLLAKQKDAFGNGASSSWVYLAVFDSRPADVLYKQLALAKLRHNSEISNHGTFFVIGVITDDCKSILLLSLFIAPLALQATSRDYLLLGAKRWNLAAQASSEPLAVLARVILKVYGLNTDHDCRKECNHLESTAHIMAPYVRDRISSLQSVAGDYWNISGKTWTKEQS